MTSGSDATGGTVSEEAGAPENAGIAFAKLLEEQLVEERARKTSLEARGAAIITTSGALVTLLFGLAALVTGQDGFELGDQPRNLLGLGVLAFFAAALAGLAVNFPWRYTEVTAKGFSDLLPHWDAAPQKGLRAAFEARRKVYARAREVNGYKAIIVFLGMALEVVGVVLVATAVRSILLG